MATSSQGQGLDREVWSEGSRRQNREPMNKKVIQGLVPETRQPPVPMSGGRGTGSITGNAEGNPLVVRGKRTFLFGEICLRGGLPV